MPEVLLGEMAEGRFGWGDYALAIPALYLAPNDFEGAERALRMLASFAGGGFIPTSPSDPAPDAFASLWFIRAAHFYGTARPGEYFSETLLPLCKELLHQFISGEGVGGVRMDDGGILVPPPAPHPIASQTLRLNSLWYSGIESIGTDLKAHANPVADHFERLAGRFRRSFSKAYWCDAHGRICTTDVRPAMNGENGSQNGGTPAVEHGEYPDPDQILLTFLPGSPIPRTKQKQMLQQFKAKSRGPSGIKLLHPSYGVVESPMYLAWLATGLRASADNEQIGLAEAESVLEPLLKLRDEGYLRGMPAYFRDGKPVEGEPPSAVTTAEVTGVLSAMGVLTR